jgi:hypothetical protein
MKPSTVPPTLEFRISMGIPVSQKEGDVYKKNAVTSNLVDETAIATIPGLVNVVTTDTISHNGKIVGARKGYVYIQSGDLLQYLNNNKLGKKKAITMYEVIKSAVARLEKDASEGRAPKFNTNELLFINNILNLKNPKGELKDNQIWFDVDNLTVKLGKKSIKFSELASKEQEIIEQLSEMYHSASAKTLRSGSPFFEYFFEDGKLQEREWKNYQSYLVSGKDRAVSDIPFVTIANPTAAQPYSFAGKYATLINFETGDEGYVPSEKEQEPPKPSQSGTPTKPSDVIESDVPVVVKFTNKQGEEFTVSLNDGSENTIPLFGGNFTFKASILPTGEIEIDTISPETNAETIQKFADTPAKIAAARKKYPTATEGLSDIDAATVFYIGEAADKIEAAINAGQTSAPAPVAPTATVSDIEAKKADIESLFSINAQSIIDNKEDILSNPTKYETTQTVGNVTTEQTVDVSKGNITVTQRISSNDKSIYFSNRIYLSSKGEVSSIISRGGGISFFKDKSGVVNEEAKLKMVNLAETVKNYFPEIFSKIQEYAKKYKGFITSIDNFRETVRQAKFIDAFDSFLYNKDLLSDIDFARITLHNAELAALEGAKPTEQPVEKKEAPAGKKKGLSGLKSGVQDEETRRVRTGESTERISDRDIEAFKAWHAKNVPNIPFEILESIITLHDGSKAWGVFEDGVAKFFKSGLRGTEYHEVFEGIWKAFLTQGERQAILDEFKAKRGNFLDRESGQLVDYSQATDRQAKERIADDFADYRLGKLPARTLSEKIRNFFKAIVDFFKTFVAKPSLKDDLFNSIDTGKFAEYVVSENAKSAAPEYRKIRIADGSVISEDQAWAIVQDMTITMAEYIFNRNNTDGLDKLFSPLATTGKDIYNA